MTEEIWKDVPGYNGRYRVSNLGRVFGVTTSTTLKGQVSNTGYRRVTLYTSRKEFKVLSVHRLVLTAFVRGPVEGDVCNHIDGQRLNNALSNLEWTTVSGNLKHAHKMGLVNQTGERNPSSRFSNKVCVEIIKLLQNSFNFVEISKLTGVNTSLISNINRGISHRTISSKFVTEYPIRGVKANRFFGVSRESLKDLQSEGMRVKDIAEKYGVSVSVVERRLYAKPPLQ